MTEIKFLAKGQKEYKKYDLLAHAQRVGIVIFTKVTTVQTLDFKLTDTYPTQMDINLTNLTNYQIYDNDDLTKLDDLRFTLDLNDDQKHPEYENLTKKEVFEKLPQAIMKKTCFLKAEVAKKGRKND